jgi:hypothetical protein
MNTEGIAKRVFTACKGIFSNTFPFQMLNSQKLTVAKLRDVGGQSQIFIILFSNSHGLVSSMCSSNDRLCGLVVRVLGYRSGGPGSIPGTTRKKKVVGLERGPLSLVSSTEELLDRKVAAPV